MAEQADGKRRLCTKHVQAGEGVIGLRLKVRLCQNSSCSRYHKAYRPEAEGQYVLPQHEFGLDIIAQIGAWRYRDHRSVPEMHTLLRARLLPISERTVSNLLDRYDELLALSLLDIERLQRVTRLHGRVILALDALQPAALGFAAGAIETSARTTFASKPVRIVEQQASV